MNVLFLTLYNIDTISERDIYSDLMRKFRDQGHNVVIVSPAERRNGTKTCIYEHEGVRILKVRTLNIQKTNIIEKGLGTLLFEYQYLLAIKRFLDGVKFELVLYSTPPITLTSVIKSLKRKHQSRTYLMLKDIFPQNAIDLGMIKKGGLLHTLFRRKERELYRVSDFIGTMSPANVLFLLNHNDFIPPGKVEICPNSTEILPYSFSVQLREDTRTKYGIPLSSIVLVYGGNLGIPQGLGFMLEVLEANLSNDKVFFVIVGSGTEFPRVKAWFEKWNPRNAMLLSGLPKKEYDVLVQSCDVGLIFLDRRFTIPNFPSRLLSYLENKMPVLVASDPNTDMGTIAQDNGFGFWSLSGDLATFNTNLNKLLAHPGLISQMGEKGYTFLLDHYTVDHSYQKIMSHFSEN
jgi:glycosyltransferase involved in cell wall biosynthesis